MLSQLQSEGVEVSKAKSTLLKLKDYASVENPGLNAASKDLTDQIAQNKDLIRNAINYLQSNRENIDETTLGKLNSTLNAKATGETTDPIEALQSLSRKELAQAYDVLLNLLNQREELIENRIKEQIDHLGIEERILFEEKDWSKEVEDIKGFYDPFNGEATMKAE